MSGDTIVNGNQQAINASAVDIFGHLQLGFMPHGRLLPVKTKNFGMLPRDVHERASFWIISFYVRRFFPMIGGADKESFVLTLGRPQTRACIEECGLVACRDGAQ